MVEGDGGRWRGKRKQNWVLAHLHGWGLLREGGREGKKKGFYGGKVEVYNYLTVWCRCVGGWGAGWEVEMITGG